MNEFIDITEQANKTIKSYNYHNLNSDIELKEPWKSILINSIQELQNLINYICDNNV